MKKIVSFMLSIIMVISLIPKLDVSVSAMGYDPSVVVNLALSKVGTNYMNGYCLAFVRQMFESAYGFSSTSCCAYKYGSKFIDNTSRTNIPLGADVFFGGSSKTCSTCGNKCGHIGIYVGDDYVVHGWNGKIEKFKIDRIINSGYPYRGWGWHNDIALGNVSTNPDDYSVPTRNIYYTSPVMKGNDVGWVQAVLYQCGYNINIDCSFGPSSKAVVEQFQKDNGLKVDGSVGPATREKLKQKWEEKKKSNVTLLSIAVAAYPSKTSYYIGESLDLTGLTLTAKYSDGTTKTVTEDYSVSGFDSSSAGTKTITVSFDGKTTTFTVTVKEPEPKTYTIAFNANGGSGTMSNVTMTCGVAKNLPANTFTRSGYTFLGWSKDKNATTATYADKQSVKDLASSGTVTLYAVWKASSEPQLTLSKVSSGTNTGSTNYGGKFEIAATYYSNGVEDCKQISSITYKITFDPKVLKYTSFNTAFDQYEVNTNNLSQGYITIASTNLNEPFGGNVFGAATFEVIAKNQCSTNISVSVTSAYNGSETRVTDKIKGSSVDITVNSGKLGDLTGDGYVDILDAKWMLQAAAGSRTLTDAQKAVADVNKDGYADILDAKWLLQAAAGSRTIS